MKRDYFSMEPLEVYKLVCTGKIKKFPNNYLDRESIKIIVRHVVFNVYGYTNREQICALNQDFFIANSLGGARRFFEQKNYKLLAYCFPEMKIMPWECGACVNNNFWKAKQNRTDFVIWLAKKEGLSLTSKDDIKKINAKMIKKYGCCNAMRNAGGIYNLIEPALKVKSKEWELFKVSSWSQEMAIEAVHWLVEEKLCLTEQEVCNLKTDDFKRYNLDGMLQKTCDHSVFKALSIAYPGKYNRTGLRTIVLNN